MSDVMTGPLADAVLAAASLLHEAERPIRVLRGVSWPDSVKARFFADGARALPQVRYTAIDPSPTLEVAGRARTAIAAIGTTGVAGVMSAWLTRQADAIEGAARMLAVIGTPAFYEHSARLYGRPRDTLPDGESSVYGLAEAVRGILAHLVGVDLGAPPAACHLASVVADELRRAVDDRFGADAPLVEVVDTLSANALAGPQRIRLRRSACFTDRDAAQLIQHEAFIHVATSLSGRAQTRVPLLSAGHAGTTRTQEGLAVFSEMITGVMDADRLRRLADRVMAIQMAIDGADFIEVYGFFLEHAGAEEQAFENARRVFRGGVISGGAPFTKDLVYLDGLLRVHNFLRAVIARGPVGLIRLLFCGKLDVEDIPALSHLARAGLVQPARFTPPWAEDLRFLVAHLAYSRFLNTIHMDRVQAHYGALLDEVATAWASDPVDLDAVIPTGRAPT